MREKIAIIAAMTVIITVGSTAQTSLVRIKKNLYRGDASLAPNRTFSCREVPVAVTPKPLRRHPSEAELAKVVRTVCPAFDRKGLAGRLPTPLVIHSLRLWGKDATFPRVYSRQVRTEPLSGQTMLEILLNNNAFSNLASIYNADLLVESEFGIQAVATSDRAYGSIETSTHFGKLVQVMAECGIPAGHRVVAAGGHEGILGDVIRDDAARIVEGSELEFAISGLSRYASDGRPWRNRFGRSVSFNDLARRVMDSDPHVATCEGLHVPYCLTMLLRADEQSHLLDASVRQKVRDHLRRVAQTLPTSQLPDGSWGQNWWLRDSGRSFSSTQEDLPGRLIGTGHTLEWLAFAPEECRPTEDCIQKGMDYLVSHWDRIDALVKSDWHYFSPTTHAARALLLLSGIGPEQAFDARPGSTPQPGGTPL